MSQRKIGIFFVRTPRHKGSNEAEQGAGHSPQTANGFVHHVQAISSRQQDGQTSKQPQQRTSPGQTPLSGQKRNAIGVPLTRTDSMAAEAQLQTPQQTMPPPRPPSSARQPQELEAQRRKMRKTLSDPETRDAAALRKISETFAWLNAKNIRDAKGRRPSDPEYDARTVQVPAQIHSKLSASQKTYWDIKSRYRDVICFLKIGKFYELYEDDAQIGADLLGWKMTCSGVGHCRQVGCPESGIDEAVQRLTAAGYKVGRIEQMETAAEAKRKRGNKATIQRELTRIHTPATMSSGPVSPDAVHLMALCEEVLPGAGANDHTTIGFAFLDAAADHFYVGCLTDGAGRNNLTTLLTQVAPKEVLHARNSLTGLTARILAYPPMPTMLSPVNPGGEFPAPESASSVLSKLDGFGGDDELPEAVTRLGNLPLAALAALVLHLRRLRAVDEFAGYAALVSPYELYAAALRLDGPTLANLELLENNTGESAGSLLSRLDTCACAGGRRMLRRWLCRPLTDVRAINERADGVDVLMSAPELVAELRRALRSMPDLERALGGARNAASAPPLALPPAILSTLQKKRLAALGTAVQAVRAAIAALQDFDAAAADEATAVLRGATDAARRCGEGPAAEVLELVEEALIWPDSKGSKGKKGGNSTASAPQLAPSLLADVPAPAAAEDADDAALQAEIALTTELLMQLNACSREWEALQEAISTLDVLSSFAAFSAAAEGPTCRATFVPHGSPEAGGAAVLDLEQVWHPCARAPPGGCIVANDLELGSPAAPARSLLLTGPNMGGKSTLLRASCIAVIMAQMGCRVAAVTCRLSPADCIFTRLGAQDRILAGESTFLVECQETSSILRHATPASLVVLDELGRGTSTFDGYAIAYAVLQHLSCHVDPRMLFATHYHPLCAETAGNARIRQGHMAALVGPQHIEVGAGGTAHGSGGGGRGSGSGGTASSDGITFLYKLQDAPCDKSYGLSVAGLAGIPQCVRSRAAKAGLQLEAALQASFEDTSTAAGASSTTDGVAGEETHEMQVDGSHTAAEGAGAGWQLPAEAVTLVQQLAAVLGSSHGGGGGGGGGGGAADPCTAGSDMAALQSLWQQAQRLVGPAS